MAFTQPLDSELSIALDGQQYINCGAFPDLSFGGAVPYTIEAWVKLTSIKGTQSIISKYNGGIAAEYALTVQNGVVISQREVAPWGLSSKQTLNPNQWYHIATTYDGATLSLYINGVLENSAPFSAQASNPTTSTYIGAMQDHGKASAFFYGEINEVRLWNVCRTSSQIFKYMDNIDDEAAGLVAYYACWYMPPFDQANAHPLTVVGSPNYEMDSPGLLLDGSSYVDCGNFSNLSLGGYAPYTLEGWINLTSTKGTQSIISKYNGGIAAEYALTVQNGVVISQREVAPWGLSSKQTLNPNQWYHIATTYDGATLSLYINGVLENSAPFSAQASNPTTSTYIGAMQDHGKSANFFHGYIQTIRVWKVALSSDQIAAAMSYTPILDMALIANYDFSIEPASDLTGTHALNLKGSPTITTLMETIKILEISAPPLTLPEKAPKVEYFSKEHIKTLTDEYRSAFGSSFDPEKHSKNIDEYSALLNRLKDDFSPTSTRNPHTNVFQRGSYHHFQYFNEGVLKSEFTIESANITPYQMWLMTFIYTLVNGFCDLAFGINIPQRAWDRVGQQIINDPTVTQKVAACIAALTGASVLGVMDALYQTGYLKSLILMSLTMGGWWVISRAVLRFFTWLVPGAAQAELFAKIANLLISLGYQLSTMPSPPLLTSASEPSIEFASV